MAKDPAFLFYTSDFLTGTMFMSNEQVGIYIRLLCSQHQHGGLISKENFESLVKDDNLIMSKFIETDNGFYNIRLMEVMQERSKKSSNISSAVKEIWEKRKNDKKMESHKNPIAIPSKSDAIPLESHKKRTGIPMGPENVNIVIEYFLEKGYKEEIARKAFEYYSTANWHDANGKPVRNWKQKMQAVWFTEENKIKKPNQEKMVLY